MIFFYFANEIRQFLITLQLVDNFKTVTINPVVILPMHVVVKDSIDFNSNKEAASKLHFRYYSNIECL